MTRGDRTTRVIGFAGWHNAGKTTVLAGVIPILVSRGLAVSTIKRAHHEFDVDRPGRIRILTALPARMKSLFLRQSASR